MNLIGRRLGLSRAAICGVLVAALSCACTNLASGNDRLSQPVEVGGGPSSWDCLTNRPTDQLKPLEPAPQGILYVVPIFDLAHLGQRIPNLSIQVCAGTDDDCSQPLAEWESKNGQKSGKILINDITMMSDGIPLYSFVFPYVSQATFYLRLNSLPAAPMQRSPYLQFEYYFEGPLIRGNAPDTTFPATASTPAVTVPTLVGLPITMLSVADAVKFGNGIQITLDPMAAIVAPRIIDCTGTLAEKVLLTTTADGAIGFTFVTDHAARGTGNAPGLTSRTGIAGFYVPLPLPGSPSLSPNITLEGISPAPGSLPFGRINTKVRSGQVTSGEIRPYSDQSGR